MGIQKGVIGLVRLVLMLSLKFVIQDGLVLQFSIGFSRYFVIVVVQAGVHDGPSHWRTRHVDWKAPNVRLLEVFCFIL